MRCFKMQKISIDEMLSGKKSRYSLVIGIAKRAREIASNAEQNGNILTEKPVNLAINDFKEHKYELFEPQVND